MNMKLSIHPPLGISNDSAVPQSEAVINDKTVLQNTSPAARS